MTLESHAGYVELNVPGLDHARNLERMVAKQVGFAPSTLTYGPDLEVLLHPGRRTSLSLTDDPDVARISSAIEAHIAARLPEIVEALRTTPFRIGATSSSCVCFRNGAFFRTHVDVVKHVAGRRRLTWVYYLNSEPKRFSGGNLLLGRPRSARTVVEPAHGRIVVFPSSISHEITPVRLEPDDFGNARFGITGFISEQPTRAARLKLALGRLRRRLRPRRSRAG